MLSLVFSDLATEEPSTTSNETSLASIVLLAATFSILELSAYENDILLILFLDSLIDLSTTAL